MKLRTRSNPVGDDGSPAQSRPTNAFDNDNVNVEPMETRLRPRVDGKAVVAAATRAATVNTPTTGASKRRPTKAGSKARTPAKTKAKIKPAAQSKVTIRKAKPTAQLRPKQTAAKGLKATVHKSKTQSCLICANDLTMDQFPEEKTTAACQHTNNVCRNCITRNILFRIQYSPEHIDCPSCRHAMQPADLKVHTDEATYKRIEKLTYNRNVASKPNHHWCQAPNCEAGQTHSDVHKPFSCNTCEAVSCVSCGGPWHEDQTCEQRQQALKLHPKEDEKKMGKLGVKRCPGKDCGARVEKDGGCSHMTCTRCKMQFCWYCLAGMQEEHGPECPHRPQNGAQPDPHRNPAHLQHMHDRQMQLNIERQVRGG